jgi:hypothetical protein
MKNQLHSNDNARQEAIFYFILQNYIMFPTYTLQRAFLYSSSFFFFFKKRTKLHSNKEITGQYRMRNKLAKTQAKEFSNARSEKG